MSLHMWYLICNDPSLLARRLKEHEERETQKTLQKFAKAVWLTLFLVSGLDSRFGWSSVPWPVVVVADVFVLGGQLLLFLVIKANSYASGVIELQEGQTVITTGPYALVRHPMYQAAMVMILFTPLALGSYWALFPALCLTLFYVKRIRDEEEMLLEELAGYREYMQETPYRLIPGIW
jgi:protein-S-isoprenylcysteine O-methyltransferase Ste14